MSNPEAARQLYYVEKNGVCRQGVYWIGLSLDDARKAADQLASNDIDDYHDWLVFLLASDTIRSGETADIIYKGIRTVQA
jgi:hypothetical protein